MSYLQRPADVFGRGAWVGALLTGATEVDVVREPVFAVREARVRPRDGVGNALPLQCGRHEAQQLSLIQAISG